MSQPDTARLLIACDDQPGIVAAVAGVLAQHGANIISLDQHSTDSEGGRFFQRTVIHLDGLSAARPALEADIAGVAERFGMEWSLHDVARRKRVAIFVSKYDHCLMELLWRTQRGQLDIDITMVVSNHPDLAEAVRSFGVPFVHIPSGDKAAMEERQLELLRGNVDLVVLARYMQILTDDFITRLEAPVINIHHSFLPAFIGANPYARAKDRGVKLIGATAHYATADLDEGPIIEQDVTRVTHSESAAELQSRGADVERLVLARAVQWHAEDRVIVHGKSTVIL
ncbi:MULTISPECIES: formyltetrahydrofolate deformylase [Microbacterium]|jgi:formyltetrahydrofolate deformylase|uniref:Formyltetrahydrofolate deformylase n=3 Tax=Microbacterium TaxID=33882 RepID=A0A4Y4BCG3_MICMQ|nr:MULTISPECIES: formyltetrahydrofolate deformylase [Microbacterium]AZS48432.1 Formyltetrahydrofolate deformylase [Microbacterium oxydans]EYT60114.1 formyltetrahydrofolate deformylase [Microbacterium sp. UCD-TDU]KAB1886355.1 formyltetrahydrofolate deformylase [Microbacterium liquefaciens]KQV02241.1 formyltetrahydrofolate deformylase [Microbacterium sp. Root322]KQY77708.1 formyltetrahydrofolate deformylase [Microbacterium sp. Root1433D1]